MVCFNNFLQKNCHSRAFSGPTKLKKFVGECPMEPRLCIPYYRHYLGPVVKPQDDNTSLKLRVAGKSC